MDNHDELYPPIPSKGGSSDERDESAASAPSEAEAQWPEEPAPAAERAFPDYQAAPSQPASEPSASAGEDATPASGGWPEDPASGGLPDAPASGGGWPDATPDATPLNSAESATADMTPTYDAASFDAPHAVQSGATDGSAAAGAEPAEFAPALQEAPASAAPEAMWSGDAGASVAPDPVGDAVSPVAGPPESGYAAPVAESNALGLSATPGEEGAPVAETAPVDSVPQSAADAEGVAPVEGASGYDAGVAATPPVELEGTPPVPNAPVHPDVPMAPTAPYTPPSYAPPTPNAPMAPQPPQPYAPPPSYTPPAQQFQGYAPVAPMGAPMMAPRRDKTLPLLLEILPGLLGVFGIGWMVSGRTSTGLAWLIGGLVFDFVMGIITVFTLGFGFFCWGPLILVGMIVSTLMLNQRLDSGR